MLIIDENISESEVWRLREWRIPVRLISEVAVKSIDDENIFPILHRLKRPTFFAKDRDFWKRTLVHPAYCLVHLDIPEHEGEVAAFIRRFLNHARFDTHAKRVGKVVRVHVRGMQFWQRGTGRIHVCKWDIRA